jgi:hypothetical protein
MPTNSRCEVRSQVVTAEQELPCNHPNWKLEKRESEYRMMVCDVIVMRAKDGRSPRQIFSAAEISQMIHLLTTPRQ